MFIIAGVLGDVDDHEKPPLLMSNENGSEGLSISPELSLYPSGPKRQPPQTTTVIVEDETAMHTEKGNDYLNG